MAFSTANPRAAYGGETGTVGGQTIANDHLDPLLYAAVLASEEAIINSMIAAEDLTGKDGVSIKALPHEQLREVMRKYGRIQ